MFNLDIIFFLFIILLSFLLNVNNFEFQRSARRFCLICLWTWTAEVRSSAPTAARPVWISDRIWPTISYTWNCAPRWACCWNTVGRPWRVPRRRRRTPSRKQTKRAISILHSAIDEKCLIKKTKTKEKVFFF